MGVAHLPKFPASSFGKLQEKKLFPFTVQKLDSLGLGKKEIRVPIPPHAESVFEFWITAATSRLVLLLQS